MTLMPKCAAAFTTLSDLVQSNVAPLDGCTDHQLRSQRTHPTPSCDASYIPASAATGARLPQACDCGMTPLTDAYVPDAAGVTDRRVADAGVAMGTATTASSAAAEIALSAVRH